ncbi:MAG: hypothetical protein JSC189_001304 [Candidatus Tokpelaia sp. JSC189]|nr:MAG: hypothetical protein JSC189_001304 [Candidatus Tokpelaia sp. JSC189]
MRGQDIAILRNEHQERRTIQWSVTFFCSESLYNDQMALLIVNSDNSTGKNGLQGVISERRY